jgi:Ca2+-binding RTX toxin-like protein
MTAFPAAAAPIRRTAAPGRTRSSAARPKITRDGGSENDNLSGGGANLFEIDQASYAGAGGAVTIDLSLAIQAGGDAAGDSYTGIEGVLGSKFNDTLIGNGAANSLSGGSGDDRFVLGANFTAADSVDSGAGSKDTLVLDGNYAGGIAFAAATMTNVETVSLVAGNNYKLTLADANNGGTLTVDGGALGANTLFLTASAEKSSSLTALGAAGNDTLTGGGGNDFLTGGGGADRLTGGGGLDTVLYAASGAGVTVNLNLTTAQISTGDANGDILSGIENIVGTILADKLTGNASANELSGGDQGDTLTGGAGADSLDGGLGVDTADYSGSKAGITIDFSAGAGKGGDAAGDRLIDIETVIGSKSSDTFIESVEAHEIHGGAGTDLVDYSASSAITIDLASAGAQAGGLAEDDVLIDVESVIGSKLGDEIKGSIVGNKLDASAGKDTLDAGAGGDDTLLGGENNDEIFVTNTLTAKDQIDGGAHDDDTATPAIEGDVLEIEGDYSAGLTLAATTIRNVEAIVLKDGFSYAFKANNATNGDVLTIDASELGAGNSLKFDASAETSNGYIFQSGAGADTLTGGKGIDQLDFSKATVDVFADLAVSANNGGFAAGDVYAGIENIRGSDLNDQFTGDKRNNLLEGGFGDDTLIGGAGNDTLSGGQGTQVGNDGGDFLEGGDGIDVVSYADSDASVIADLSNLLNGGNATGDQFVGIEILIGTNFDDELGGDDANNRIEGGKGFDFLSGGLGNDTLIGGGDTDIFFETELSVGDRIDGGGEVDDPNTEFVFEGDSLTLAGDYSTGFAFGSMTVRNVEKFELLGGGLNYVLKLHDATNSSSLIVDASSLFDFDIFKLDGSSETKHALTVWDGAGNDTITDGAGADVLAGGLGGDLLTGGKGLATANSEKSFEGVTVDLSLKTAQVSAGEASGDVLVLIENLQGSDFDDLLIGDKNGNLLEGGKGNDTLTGGLGLDIASYEHALGAIDINLLDPTKNAGDAAGDVFGSIEGVIGTVKDDTILGNGSANYIDGGAGNDTLTAGSGNDTVLGGKGDDIIRVGFSLNAGDQIDGGDDKDVVVLDGNYSTNVVLGKATLVDVEVLELTTGNNYRLTLADGNNSSSHHRRFSAAGRRSPRDQRRSGKERQPHRFRRRR